MSAPLAFTGERFVPGTHGEIWIEHWHRYHFAARLAAGKRVVDCACGEGYGAAHLARVAASVTGVDISPEALAHARRTYGGLANLAYVEASCTRLPLPDSSADLFVSFETIEHIEGQEAFLDEIRRVLAPDGLLLLSCPNKLEYSDKRDYANPFHVKELYREELAALVASRFPHLRWYGQRLGFHSLIAPEAGAETGHLVEAGEADPGAAAPALEAPLYFLLLASRSAATVGMLPGTLSVLADRDDWKGRDYDKILGELRQTVARGEALEKQVAEREAAVQALRGDLDAARRDCAAREQAVAAQARALAERDAALEAGRAEILRRRGLRWWLKLPFIRLGLARDD